MASRLIAEMSGLYSSLALSYRRWHYRVTPVGWEHMDPAAGFAAIGVMNVFSLMMVLPLRTIPPWLFGSIPVLCGLVLYWHIHRTYRTNPMPATYAKYSDPVPGLREFPGVYGYMFLTIALFTTCLYAAVQSAA